MNIANRFCFHGRHLIKNLWKSRLFSLPFSNRRFYSTKKAVLFEIGLFDRSQPHVLLEKKTTNALVDHLFLGKSGDMRLKWNRAPNALLIAPKPGEVSINEKLVELAKFIQRTWPTMKIFLERTEHVQEHLPFVLPFKSNTAIEAVIGMGGDGTLLHISSLFPSLCPPIIPFSMGNLGFLMPFKISEYQSILKKAIEDEMSLLYRQRLECSLHETSRDQKTDKQVKAFTVLNEVTVHRGTKAQLIEIEIYINDQLLTRAVVDGLIVATPTGSTAYSLSAGGSVVHPHLDSMLLTPICPRSLSFRPALLPAYSKLTVKICNTNVSGADVSFDGRHTVHLSPGSFLEIGKSNYPLPTMISQEQTTDWVLGINKLLYWNQPFSSKHANKN